MSNKPINTYPFGESFRNRSINSTITPFSCMPSELLLKFAKEITSNSNGQIVDVACGYGRNAIYMASLGVDVLCIDRNRAALSYIDAVQASISKIPHHGGILSTLRIDLTEDPWPFSVETLGAIIMVHYFPMNLFEPMLASLQIGGYFFIESIDGRGGNYLELPKQGFVLEKMIGTFELIHFKEKKVGPPESNASTIKLFAKKTRSSPQPE